MLHSYAFSNFRSFRERVEVPFTLTEKDAVNGWDRISRQSRQRLTTAMAVLGGNASGKTSLIQPLAFLAWFVRYSFSASPDSGVPVPPHFNGQSSPTEFEVIVDAPDPETLLRYRLSATTQHVLSESLEQGGRASGMPSSIASERVKVRTGSRRTDLASISPTRRRFGPTFR
jgi:hypothetical protein